MKRYAYKNSFTLIERPAASKGFTLIELLVVVAIIVALLAILLPSLNNAIAIANSAACASNQRQIGLAHLSYTADSRGVHPPSSTDPTQPHWLDLLNKYTGDMDAVRYCPETDQYKYDPSAASVAQRIGSRTQTWWLQANTYGVGFYGGGSYGVNIFTHSTSGWGSPINKHFTTIQDTNRPHNTAFLADCIWHNAYPRENDTPPTTEPNGSFPPNTMGRYLIRRHLGAINVAMLDSSVRIVELEDMWTLDWHKNFTYKGNVAVPY